MRRHVSGHVERPREHHHRSVTRKQTTERINNVQGNVLADGTDAEDVRLWSERLEAERAVAEAEQDLKHRREVRLNGTPSSARDGP